MPIEDYEINTYLLARHQLTADFKKKLAVCPALKKHPCTSLGNTFALVSACVALAVHVTVDQSEASRRVVELQLHVLIMLYYAGHVNLRTFLKRKFLQRWQTVVLFRQVWAGQTLSLALKRNVTREF